MGTDLAITLMLAFLDRAAAYGALISKARAEGRDVTDAELDELAREDDAARADLVAAIAKRKAGG